MNHVPSHLLPLLLAAAACGGPPPQDARPFHPSPAQSSSPPAAIPADEPREPPRAPHGLTPAGALGHSLLLGSGSELGDDDILAAWQLLVRDPAGAAACRDLATDAFTFRGVGLGLLGLVADDAVAVRTRLEEVLGPLPVESPRQTDSGASGADEPPLGDLCETLSPAGRLALLAFEETPGHVLRPDPGSLGPASLAVLLAEPRARDLLRAVADEGPTLHARVAGLLGLAVLDPRACADAVKSLRGDPADAPDTDAALAMTLLEATSRFEGEAVGEGGETPATCWAFRVLLARPDATEWFGRLAEDDRLPPRLYAACGLRLADEPASRPLVAKLRTEGGTVPTFFGCILSSDSVQDLLAQIESGALPRELAGR